MKIIITGHPKKVSKRIIRLAAEFFADKLMTERLHSGIHCEIIFSNKMSPGTNAECQPYYDANTSFPKIFDVTICDGLSKRLTLECLGHELTHLKQYARSELLDYHYKENLSRWKDSIYRNDPAEERHNSENYWLAPWEIEARGYESGLLKLFSGYMKERGEPLFGRNTK